MSACLLNLSADTWASIVTAGSTVVLAGITWWLVRSTIQEGRRSTGLQLFSQLVESYQGETMRRLRSRTALTLQGNFGASPAGAVLSDNFIAFEAIDLTVLEFFENLGRLVRMEALDPQITWNYFADAVQAYWRAAQPTIQAERDRVHEDDLFTDFEWLSQEFAVRNANGHRLAAPRLPSYHRCLEFLASEVRLML